MDNLMQYNNTIQTQKGNDKRQTGWNTSQHGTKSNNRLRKMRIKTTASRSNNGAGPNEENNEEIIKHKRIIEGR